MIKDTDIAKYPLPQKISKTRSIVEIADEKVDIRDILNSMGRWTPSGTFYSYKFDCPWNYEHPDGGIDKNCRLFGSTNIWCWAHEWYITPTFLYAKWKNVSRQKAAEILLDERGLLKKPWRETWNELVDLRDQDRELGSKNEVITALHTALDNNSVYTQMEFSNLVRDKWNQVLSVLDSLWEMPEMNYETLNVFFERSLVSLLNCAKIASVEEQ